MVELVLLCLLVVCSLVTTACFAVYGHRISVSPDWEDPTHTVTSSTYDAWAPTHVGVPHEVPLCPVSGAAAQNYVDAWYRAAHELAYIHRHLPAAHQKQAEKATGDLVRSLRAFVPAEYLSTTAAILNAEHRRRTERG